MIASRSQQRPQWYATVTIEEFTLRHPSCAAHGTMQAHPPASPCGLDVDPTVVFPQPSPASQQQRNDPCPLRRPPWCAGDDRPSQLANRLDLTIRKNQRPFERAGLSGLAASRTRTTPTEIDEMTAQVPHTKPLPSVPLR
jgi:hypothetical protein